MSTIRASAPHPHTGYKSFELGAFSFSRDEYFVTVSWPAREAKLSHTMPVDAFLKALMRDVSWGFFYGWVNFDAVLGTRNRYGSVELYAGRYNDGYHDSVLDYVETFGTPHILATFKAVLTDWTNAGFDPFAAPAETGTTVFGKKNGDNIAAIERTGKRAGACRGCPMMPRYAQTTTAIPSIGRFPMSTKTSRRFRPSPALRTRSTPLTCLNICLAPT